jgi:predicted amidophosphoribosyltransferase
MKWLYKIWSGYNGFTPGRIPERAEGKHIDLGWRRYIETVERGDRVWVYFYGPHRFEAGVHITGVITRVDLDTERVRVRMDWYSTTTPITDAATASLVARTVRARGLQVFLFPEEIVTDEFCTLASDASSCSQHRCGTCTTWSNELPRIGQRDYYWPERLDHVDSFVPAYWVRPRRSLFSNLRKGVRNTSEVFYRFKSGEENLTHTLALGVASSLTQQAADEFDCVVPIPLSPDKAKRGEFHRTLALARQIGALLDLPVRDVLSLDRPISKRTLSASAAQFETAYGGVLAVKARLARSHDRILLVDDVATRGSTLTCAARAISHVHPEARIGAATAGLMTLVSTVRRETAVVA